MFAPGDEDIAAKPPGHVLRDRVGASPGHEHVAVELEERLARTYRPRAVFDQPIAVTLTERKQLLHIEPVLICEEAVDGAHPDHSCSSPNAGACRPRTDLAETLDGDPCPFESAIQPRQGRLGRRLDAVPGGEVVHPEALVSLGPEWNRIFSAVEKIGRKRTHVRPGDEDVPVRLQRVLVRGEHRGTIAAAEAHAGLRPRVGHATGRELPRHRACETGNLVDIDIGQHPRPPGRDGELLVVDHHEGLEALPLVPKLDDAHRPEPTSRSDGRPPTAAGCARPPPGSGPGRSRSGSARCRGPAIHIRS